MPVAAATTNNMLLIGAHFPTIDDLKESINQWVVTEDLSCKVQRAEYNRYKLRCRAGNACRFKLDAFPKGQFWQIKAFQPHTCPAITHHAFKLSYRTKIIASHHRDLVSTLPTTQPAHHHRLREL